MNTEQSIIKKRHHYYFLGRKFEKENNLPKAIETYKTYSTHLADADKHIPHQWISKFYDKLGETKKALLHLEEFAKGCTKPRAADVYKEIAERYVEINDTQKAILNFERAMEKNPVIGVKKKLDELKNTSL